MKFNDRYSGTSIGFRDEREGIIRSLLPGHCSQCLKTRKLIFWIDMETGEYVCSEECLQKLRDLAKD